MPAFIASMRSLILRMRRPLVLGAISLWLLLMPRPAAAQTIIYVMPTGSGGGTSWADAAGLQDALTTATPDSEIWAATGIYTPGASISSTFVLTDGVALFGGFAATETQRSQRDWLANPTILSGDLTGNDTTDITGLVTDTANIAGTNAYHVVTGSGTNSSAVLDGFFITAGAATGAFVVGCGPSCGGGLFNISGSPTLANLSFDGNLANYGGGMYNSSDNNTSSPTLTNVSFRGNTADGSGGAMNNVAYNGGTSSPTLTNVSFLGNSAGNDGGAMDNYTYLGGTSSPTLINVSISGNTADYGGGIANFASDGGTSSPTLTNVSFSGNTAGVNGGALSNTALSGNSSPQIRNSALWGNTATNSGSQIFNNGDVPTIAYSIVQGGDSGSNSGTAFSTGPNNLNLDPLFVDAATGDLRPQPASPAIDAGNNTAVPVSVTTDLAGNPRISAVILLVPTVDIGAFEASNSSPAFVSAPSSNATEDLTYTYAISSADPNQPSSSGLTLTGVVVPAWLNLIANGAGGTLSGTPTNSDVGGHAVTLQVQDTVGLTKTQSFTVNVANSNDAPSLTSIPVTTAAQDSPYSYSITTSDVDVGDNRTLTAPVKPAWLILTDNGDGTATFSGTPSNADVGNNAVTLQVQDTGGLTDTQSFTINVTNVNDAPTFTSTPVTAATQNSPFTYNITATDPDAGDNRTLTALVKPAWLTLTDHGDGSATLSGTPTNSDVGDHPVALQVQDTGGLIDTQSFTIDVTDLNEAPSFASTPITAATEGAPYTYAITTTDIDAGDSRSLSAPVKPAWLSLTDNGDGSGTLNGTPTAGDVGNHPVTLQVQDTGGLTDTQSFTVTVTATTGSISGTVEIDGAGVPGITVTVNSDAATNAVNAVSTAAVIAQDVTDAQGTYSFSGLTPGPVTLTFAPPTGFITPSPESVVVEAGKTKTVSTVTLDRSPTDTNTQLYLPSLIR